MSRFQPQNNVYLEFEMILLFIMNCSFLMNTVLKFSDWILYGLRIFLNIQMITFVFFHRTDLGYPWNLHATLKVMNLKTTPGQFLYNV